MCAIVNVFRGVTGSATPNCCPSMASESIPSTMEALITQADKTAKVQEIPVPTIADDEILVKNVAVAQNPTDWQYIENVTNVGTICGTDWSGNVVQVGKDVTTLSVGDHVAGFTQGGNYTDRGAYAQYVKTPAELAWKIPGTISYEQAATMGCAFWTAVQALFHPTRIGLVEPPNKIDKPEWVFVYGGSSSVGMFAIQLAHLAGYKVITVASAKNWDLCKSLGADVVFDYKDPEVVSKIKDTTQNSLHHGFDTIGNLASQSLSLRSYGPGPGKLIVIQPPQPEAQKLRGDVIIQHTLIYTSLGWEFRLRQLYPPAPEDRAHMAAFLKKLPELVSSGSIQPNPIKLWAGGLENITDGLQYMREGKNSAEKIVYRL